MPPLMSVNRLPPSTRAIQLSGERTLFGGNDALFLMQGMTPAQRAIYLREFHRVQLTGWRAWLHPTRTARYHDAQAREIWRRIKAGELQ